MFLCDQTQILNRQLCYWFCLLRVLRPYTVFGLLGSWTCNIYRSNHQLWHFSCLRLDNGLLFLVCSKQLIGVIKDLKQREDYLIRQQKQGEKINEHERRLAIIEERNCDQEQQLAELHERNSEQDERFRLSEEKNCTRDAVLEDYRQRESEQEKKIADLELRVKTLESNQNAISAKRTMLYWVFSIGIGLIGVILGVFALLK